MSEPSGRAVTFEHATAVVVGSCGILIRGPSGAGKTSLALALIDDAERRGGFARLVGDDRILLSHAHRAVIARPHPRTAGFMEIRSLGIVPRPFLDACVVHLVVDLCIDASAVLRLPDDGDRAVLLGEIGVPRLALRSPPDAFSRIRLLEKAQLMGHPP